MRKLPQCLHLKSNMTTLRLRSFSERKRSCRINKFVFREKGGKKEKNPNQNTSKEVDVSRDIEYFEQNPEENPMYGIKTAYFKTISCGVCFGTMIDCKN